MHFDPKSLKILRKFPQTKFVFKNSINKAFFDIGKLVKRTAIKRIVNKNKTGRVYNLLLRGIRVVHRASAPGESPARFTAALDHTIDYTIRKKGGVMVIGAGSSKVNYAKELELKKKRPYLKPSILNNQGTILGLFNKRILKNINKLR